MHHFAHESCADCDAWSEGETEWHLDWKSCVPEDQREVVIGCHRADAVHDGIVWEFQHSSISSKAIREREEFYGERMAWIFDCCDADADERIDLYPLAGCQHLRRFRWKHFRRSLLNVQRTLFLDLGEGWMLRVGKLNRDGSGWGYFATGVIARLPAFVIDCTRLQLAADGEHALTIVGWAVRTALMADGLLLALQKIDGTEVEAAIWRPHSSDYYFDDAFARIGVPSPKHIVDDRCESDAEVATNAALKSALEVGKTSKEQTAWNSTRIKLIDANDDLDEDERIRRIQEIESQVDNTAAQAIVDAEAAVEVASSMSEVQRKAAKLRPLEQAGEELVGRTILADVSENDRGYATLENIRSFD